MKKSNSMQVRADEIEPISPKTENQARAFDYWAAGHNLVLSGSAGTGKTFMALYFAFKELLAHPDKYRKVMIMRSVVPTRELGFLQGGIEEKKNPFSSPYPLLCDEIFGYSGSYGKLLSTKKLEFEITSHIRGCTYDQTIIVVDEMQNLNGHELDTVMTRMGNDCKIIFAGDYMQTDFTRNDEKNGIVKFISIVEQMSSFRVVEFGWSDIIRSDLVRDYLMTKEYLGIDL